MTLTADDARKKNNERTIARRKLLKQLNNKD